MRITESQLRRMVRYEVRQMLYENASVNKVLTIHDAGWEEVYNDPELRSQEGNINIDFSFSFNDGKTNKKTDILKIAVLVTSFDQSEKDIIKQITAQIGYEITDEFPQLEDRTDILPTPEEVMTALGEEKLNDIMQGLKDSAKFYYENE